MRDPVNQKNKSKFHGSDRFQKQKPPPKNLKEIDCWNCGQLGHYSSKCPENKKMPENANNKSVQKVKSHENSSRLD